MKTAETAPFAERATRGFFGSFFETWKLALLRSQDFFRRVRVDQTGHHHAPVQVDDPRLRAGELEDLRVEVHPRSAAAST